MVKKNFHCEICNKLGKIYRCRHCDHIFCRECILTANPDWSIPSSSESIRIDETSTHSDLDPSSAHLEDSVANVDTVNSVEHVDNNQDIEVSTHNPGVVVERSCEVINYCAFNCIKSLGENYCYDCGENYIRNKKCVSCNFTFCSMCQKNNLFDAKNILPEHYRQASLFCSKICYEIYTEQPNNEWSVCEMCGEQYFNISYQSSCDLCLQKYNFHNHKNYNRNRKKLIKKLEKYIKEKQVNLNTILGKIEPMLEEKVKKHKTIQELKVSFDKWYTSICVGNNLSYNIWDEVISDFLLIKN